MKLIAKTLHGLEEVLAEEIRELGGEHVTIMKRAVSFKGSNKLIYKANYMLRTAIRILKPIYEFEAKEEERFYREVMKYDWSFHMKASQTLAIDATVFGDYFTHSKYIALKTKDAIVDQFRNKFGERPNIDVEDPDLRLNVHIYQNNVSISIDTSGLSLYKRNYKRGIFLAPINEVLAAGMLKMMNWNADVPLVDLMCGSGTFLMEAAMLGQNIPAGYHIEKFGFMNWDHFQKELWDEVKEEADSKIELKPLKLFGNDISESTIRDLQVTVRNNDYSSQIELSQANFEDVKAPFERGMVISNPPYGERLKIDDTADLYKRMGDHLKREFRGYDAWIISSNAEALKNFGLRPSKKMTLFNGKLECKFQKFELFAGNRKDHVIIKKGYDKT